jgi:two-component system sensor kinase FixL
VSAEVAEARLRALKVPNVGRIADLVEQNAPNLASYLTEDVTGKKLPIYLRRLGSNLCDERDSISAELHALQRHVEHIKRIVSKQQDYAKTLGVIEPCRASQLVDDAIALSGESLSQLGIEVRREFADVPEALLDRHKVLQILVNLVGNARHALGAADRPDRRLTARVQGPTGQGSIEIAIEDNGVGIAPEHLAKMFTHGFTTKKEGHGFGLHMSALGAKEMGGSLTCRSAGVGCGATFVLTLPWQAPRRASARN